MTGDTYDRETDVDTDEQVANSRAAGGDPDETGGDAQSTTGTGRSDEFVGRVTGDDDGDNTETGAEARGRTR
jgi:hypothetical protein